MVGFWRRFVVVGLLVFAAGAAIFGRHASSDECLYGHACLETEKDGKGCCPAPRVDARKAAEAKKAADDAIRAADAKRTARKAAEAKSAADDAKRADDARKAAEVTPVAATDPGSSTSAGCPGDMVHAPGGTFSMGSPAGVGDDDEHPQHPVTLSGYCIDRTEVRVADYAGCVTRGKCTAASGPAKDGWDSLCNGTREDRQDHPVNCVDWNQARAYCASVKKRLPSEAEWEYAARGGDGRTYPWGNEAPSAKRLNACGSECPALGKRLGAAWKAMYEDSDRWEATAPAGSFPSGASPFGAFDMAGNVWEWTADWYGRYTAGARTNPRGPKEGTARVVRGGAWSDDDAALVRAAYRLRYAPTRRNNYLGFRCARGD